MANPDLHGKITFDFDLNHPTDQLEAPSFTYYTVSYHDSLPQFYENTLTSKLLAHIVDFSINEASHQAFLRLANPKPLSFFDKYEFIEAKEVWKFEGSIREMSIENRYRYFKGKYIRNDEQWVKERVAIFAKKSSWNFQDLLYYEDEYFEKVCENLWAEHPKQLRYIQNKGHKARGNDMNARHDDWNVNSSDSGLKNVLSDKGSEADVLREKKGGIMDEESKEDDGDFDSLGLKCIKKVKIVTRVGRMENLEDSPDTGLEPDGPLEACLKEDSNHIRTKCTSSNGDNNSEECDGFPSVSIMIDTWSFDYRNEPILDKAFEHMQEGVSFKDIAPIRLKSDMHTLNMYGYMGKNIATSEPAKC